MIMRLIGLLLLTAILCIPVQAEEKYDFNCNDDRGSNRCTAAAQEKMLGLYDLQPMEKLVGQDSQARRAMFVDGYGQDMLAISFIQPKGGDPYVEIRSPKMVDEDIKSDSKIIRETIPKAVWNEVLLDSEHFDRALKPENGAEDAMNICMHSWMYLVEAGDPAVRNLQFKNSLTPAVVKSRLEDACQPGLAQKYARSLARKSRQLMPACSLLSLSGYRNEETLLRDCLTLKGDRYVAAEALSISRTIDTLDTMRNLRKL
jgi:hypothetical protein